ncbi:DUF418 domain-containing protein [Saccharopolyspora taberi]|uniref:DUF418 domain-containing protein n=1 Tax=Saccharopolyspora taberi TaxID=60895 RepID=UPI0031E280D2
MALCGILLVNIPPVMEMTRVVDGRMLPVPHAFDMFVQQRFFPIFSLLFGVGFGIFLRRAAERAARPRVLLLRRLLMLGALGALHQILQPGEALLPYAIIGLVLLLPLSFLPWWADLALGAAALVAAVTYTSGGIAVIPGLMLIGFGLAGLPAVLHRHTASVAAVFVLSLGLSVVGLLWQEQDPLSAGFTTSSAVAGLCMATTYLTGFLLLLRTPAERPLSAVLEPLGRMALTNYVTATLLFVPLGHLLGLHRSTAWGAVLALAAGILLVQVLWSRWWLRRFRYGPLEWVWRCFTWWKIVPLRG